MLYLFIFTVLQKNDIRLIYLDLHHFLCKKRYDLIRRIFQLCELHENKGASLYTSLGHFCCPNFLIDKIFVHFGAIFGWFSAAKSHLIFQSCKGFVLK